MDQTVEAPQTKRDPHLSRDARDVAEGLGPLNSRFSGKRVLLTGAGGFLGAHFTHYFAHLNDAGHLDRPVTLVALDNFKRGRAPWIAAFENREDVDFRSADIIDDPVTERADYIIHAASIASPTYYRQHPIETMDANVIGLRSLLEHARETKPDSFLFFSSSEVYGDPHPDRIPTAEDYNGNVSFTGPRACYDESKRYGETLCVNFWRVHGVPVKIARPFNNFGPGLKISDRRVLPDFFRDVLAGKDIEMLSDGAPTRTFCYISDAIEGYLRILLSNENGEAFNIGTETPEISMADLARLVIDVSGSDRRVLLGHSNDPEYLKDNPNRRCPVIDKARSRLGYAPRVGLEEGLRRTHAYYIDNSTGSED